MKGSFYVIDFTIGEGLPDVNYSVSIMGPRAEMLCSRYYGRIEGVRPETKELMQKRRKIRRRVYTSGLMIQLELRL